MRYISTQLCPRSNTLIMIYSWTHFIEPCILHSGPPPFTVHFRINSQIKPFSDTYLASTSYLFSGNCQFGQSSASHVTKIFVSTFGKFSCLFLQVIGPSSKRFRILKDHHTLSYGHSRGFLSFLHVSLIKQNRCN